MSGHRQLINCIKKSGRILMLLFSVLACILLGGCGASSANQGNAAADRDAAADQGDEADRIVVGFSQLGAESDWRNANTQSMKATFTKENGYDLIFEDGQQKQANQMKAIRIFIQREVDYIVLAPVTETGWDTVLGEAKTAGIPVILMDRAVDVEDESLYTCRVGSDFYLEGKKAAEWLRCFTEARGIAPDDLHIVNIQGTIGASAQIGRTRGLAEAARKEGWDLMAEVTGDFTQAKGHEVMASLLRQFDNINVVYCENDNEAFGAIEAIEEAGKTTGTDLDAGEIMVISFDGVREGALDLVREGKIACIAQCNPEQGGLVSDVIRTLEEGGQPDRTAYVEEGIFTADDTVKSLEIDGTEYPITILDRK